ncbi:hypothetical protein U9M48_012107 [Paspalum notatum var. saurae]|uniref:Reverse transcriptase zinc-binding domain-containing protein n=1 Tax=Paspalum notatum var. saurae TaxID=547442 RepID=A0AAQ3SWY6_PASNO
MDVGWPAFLALSVSDAARGVGCTPYVGLIWSTWGPLRVKIFLWLASQYRLWTADRRHKHGLEAHETCLLCEVEPESVDHLFVHCRFTLDVWNVVLAALGAGSLGLSGLTSVSGEVGILGAWIVWKEQNARCFRRVASDVVSVR